MKLILLGRVDTGSSKRNWQAIVSNAYQPTNHFINSYWNVAIPICVRVV